MKTSDRHSPWDLLPVPEPKTVSPPLDHFYETTAKHLIKDTVRIMQNGLPIDLDKVAELEVELDRVLASVQTTLDANPIVKRYQQQRFSKLVEDYKNERRSKLKPSSKFLKTYKQGDMTHRSYAMTAYAKAKGLPLPKDLLPTGCPKWPVRGGCDKYKSDHIFVQKVIAKTISPKNNFVLQGMQALAEDKAKLHNKSYEDQIENPRIELPSFNAGSPKQKTELFDMMGLQSESTSKTTGLPSWERDQIERVNKETDDPDMQELTQAMIDFSFGAIVKNNFIKAFYAYTIDGRLYGNYRLFGAKSFRYTSQSPNMLNMPSTKSIYSKPIKKCFVAPEGYVVYAIDFSALEDRVMASLSRDANKCKIFTDGLDGHCLNAYGYFKDEISEHMPITGDITHDVKTFFDLQENGDSALKDIRQKGKPATLTPSVFIQ